MCYKFVRYADLALRYQDTILGHLFGVSCKLVPFPSLPSLLPPSSLLLPSLYSKILTDTLPESRLRRRDRGDHRLHLQPALERLRGRRDRAGDVPDRDDRRERRDGEDGCAGGRVQRRVRDPDRLRERPRRQRPGRHAVRRRAPRARDLWALLSAPLTPPMRARRPWLRRCLVHPAPS